MISTQEIKEAIKEIAQGTEQDDSHIENIQKELKKVAENNPWSSWLLERIINKQLRAEYIKLLYNREHLTNTLLAESRKKHLLSKENKILGKIVLEIMLKHSTRLNRYWKEEPKTNKQIDEMLSQSDWKEKSKFEAVESNYDSSECITHQWTDTWLVSAREPIEIIERLKDDAIRVSVKYLERLEEKEEEIKKLGEGNLSQNKKVAELEKDLKEKEKSIKQLKEENERLKEQNYQLIAQQEQKAK